MNLLFPCCFCLLLDFYDFHRRCLELRHAHADVGPDVRGVAHGVGLPADHDVVAFHRCGEADGGGQVVGVVKEYGVELQEVAH